MGKDVDMTSSGLTLVQRVAICFAAGVVGGLAVVLFSHILFGLGLGQALGAKGPVPLKSPDIYKPLFWAGLWGIPFGLFVKAFWRRLYLFGLLYFLAPVLALFIIFLPMAGAGLFGLQQGGPKFTLYLLLVNLPFGIVTALAARAMIAMSDPPKTAIVTGASQGIGAGIVIAFVERGHNVVANSRKVTRSTEVAASDQVALVDGDIGEPATAARIVETALSRFGSIDVLVNNAGIFFTKPFTDYTTEDLEILVSTNVGGFLYVTQLAIRQMLEQKTGGSIVTITAALATNPIRSTTASVPMITKGGLDTITRHLAMEYAKDGIRVNAIAPGVVYTPLHRDTPQDVMESSSPMGRPSTVQDIVDAVMYLTLAETVTGDILFVDGGAHLGRW